jgi:hypothetical protein
VTLPRIPRAARPACVALLLAGAVSGCAMRFDTRSLGVPVTMTPPTVATAAADTFNVTLRAVHLFWGLAPVKEPALQPALAGQLGTGGAVAGLTIRARKRWSDVVATVITLGFITTTSVTYQGVIVGRTAP